MKNLICENETYQGRFLRWPELPSLIGCSRDTLRRLINARSFPAPVRLSARLVGFVEQDVRSWMANRAKEKRNSVA